MEKIDIAYYAGIFDGEGCVMICKAKNKTSSRGVRYWLQCRVVNTDKWLIDSLYMAFGGSVFTRNRRDTNRMDIWDWSASSKQAGNFLEIIYPFLHVKKQEAKVALEFQSQRLRIYGKGKSMTNSQWDLQEEQMNLLKGFKKRGQYLPKL
jgi:hypothetical protein